MARKHSKIRQIPEVASLGRSGRENWGTRIRTYSRVFGNAFPAHRLPPFSGSLESARRSALAGRPLRTAGIQQPLYTIRAVRGVIEPRRRRDTENCWLTRNVDWELSVEGVVICRVGIFYEPDPGSGREPLLLALHDLKAGAWDNAIQRSRGGVLQAAGDGQQA